MLCVALEEFLDSGFVTLFDRVVIAFASDRTERKSEVCFSTLLWVPALAACQNHLSNFFKSTDCRALLHPTKQEPEAWSWTFIFKGFLGESDMQPGLLTMDPSDFQKSYQKSSV